MSFPTYRGTIDELGHVTLQDNVRLTGVCRQVLVTLLDEIPEAISETSLLSEAVLARDWNTPEEDKAWAHFQWVKTSSP